MSAKERFAAFLARAIPELHQDVKILFELMDDGNLGEEVRTRAAGALLYLLMPGDLVPESHGLLGSADDAMVMRITMAKCLEEAPDRAEHYKKRYPEVFDTLEEDLGATREFLGDIYPWMSGWVDRLKKVEFKGKTPGLIVQDLDEGAWLYDEVNEALLDVEFDQEDLVRALRKVERIVPVMRQKMEASRR